MEEVEAAIEETTAEVRESRAEEDWVPVLDLEGEGWIALAVRARMAFWDFFVPKARPNSERAESVCGEWKVSGNQSSEVALNTRWECLSCGPHLSCCRERLPLNATCSSRQVFLLVPIVASHSAGRRRQCSVSSDRLSH